MAAESDESYEKREIVKHLLTSIPCAVCQHSYTPGDVHIVDHRDEIWIMAVTCDPQNNAMMFTVPFVFYGIFRYLYLVHNKGVGGSPEEVLFKDKPLIATVFLWALAAILILFFSDHLA